LVAMTLLEAKVSVYDKEGKEVESIPLPSVFNTPFRPDIILRDVTSIRANRRQPYGSMFRAGMRHSVETWGKGRGVARVQRIKGLSRAAESPNNIGGRRAHPPRSEKLWAKKINEKERKLALKSAIACTTRKELVLARGHILPEGKTLPIVFTDDAEEMGKTVEIEAFFAALGLIEDIRRVREGRKIRAGKGKMRNRRYRQPVGPLVVVSDDKRPLFRAAKNLAGVDVCTPDKLNTEMLAPGGVPGRLTLFSRKALAALEGLQ